METDLNKVFHLNTRKSLREIQDYIDELENEIIETKRALANYDKSKEIVKRDEKIEYLQNHSLLEITDNEKQRIEDFQKLHYKKCGNGSTYDYRIEGTPFGSMLTITCPYCVECEDVTDVAAW